MHILQRVGDDLRNGQIAKPLFVRGDHVPGRLFGRAAVECILVGHCVIVPSVAFGVIAGADFPLPCRIIEPRLKPGELLIFRNRQKELEHHRVVLLCEQTLPIVDEVEALLPGGLGYQLVHPHHHHILVVRAIENRHLPATWGVRVHAPEKIVIRLLRRGLLEPVDADPLRIHGTDHVPASSILASAIDALQDNQQRAGPRPVELALQIADARQVVLQFGLRRLLGFVMAMKAGIEVLEAKFRPRVDSQRCAQAHG